MKAMFAKYTKDQVIMRKFKINIRTIRINLLLLNNTDHLNPHSNPITHHIQKLTDPLTNMKITKTNLFNHCRLKHTINKRDSIIHSKLIKTQQLKIDLIYCTK